MKKAKKSAKPSIRERAEKEWQKSNQKSSHNKAQDIEKVLQELEIHSIELEMQNEELRDTQLKLQESNQDYYDLYNFAPCGYITIDENGLIQNSNLTFSRMLGLDRNKIIKRRFTSFIAPQSQDTFYFHRNDILKTKGKNSCEIQLVKKDKSWFYAKLDSRYSAGADNNTAQIWITITEITERKKAEKDLGKALSDKSNAYNDLSRLNNQLVNLQRELTKKNAELQNNELRLQLAIKGSNDAPWDWDLIKNKLFYSPQWWEQIGYEPNELPSDPALWERLMHPDDAEHVNTVFKGALKNNTESYSVEFRLLHKEGHYLPVLSRGFISRDKNGSPIRVTGTNMDLTERKKAEEKILFDSNLLKAIGESLIATDADGKINYMNHAAEKMFGWKESEALGQNIVEVTVPQVSNKQATEIMTQLSEGKSWTGEFIVQNRKGKTFPAYVSNTPIFDNTHNLIGIIGVSTDITERKKMERKLLEAHEKLKQRVEEVTNNLRNKELQYTLIVEKSPFCIHQLDLQGKFISMNPIGLEMMSAKSEDEIKGIPFLDVVSNADKDRASNLLKLAIQGESSIFEFIGIHGNIYLCFFVPLKNIDGSVQRIIGIKRDITERKQNENIIVESRSQLRALSQRLEDIREEERTKLAREIHDELGHMLTALKYDLEELIHSPNKSKVDYKTEIENLVSLTDSLVDSVRKIATELRPGILDHLGLVPTLKWELEQFQIRTNIKCEHNLNEIEISLSDNESTVLFRIFQEILTNVMRHSEATLLNINLSAESNRVIFSIKDNGIGFNESKVSDIESLGILGMKERAFSIGGELIIDSTEGEGTVVKLKLERK